MLQSRSTDYRNAKSFLRLFCYTLIRANQPTGIRENFFSQFSQKDYFLTIALTNQIIASTFAIPESCEQCDEEKSDHNCLLTVCPGNKSVKSDKLYGEYMYINAVD